MKNVIFLSVLLIAAITGVSDSEEILCVKHNVTISSSDGGSITNPGEGSFEYLQGSSLSITANPDTGYEVDAWELDGVVDQTGGTTYSLSDIQSDHSISVAFKKIQYAITTSTGTNGSLNPGASITVSHGDDLVFTADPETGYEVNTWSVDGEVVQTGGNSYTLSDVQEPHTVEVDFRLCTYVITSTAGQNGSIDPSGSTGITYGSNVTFTASPTTGHEVDTWSVDGEVAQTGGTSYTLSNVQGPHTVDVDFKLCTYVITSAAGQNGSISPSGTTGITYGSNVTFTATPATGHEVDTWSVDGEVAQTGGTSYTLSNVQGPHTVDVDFKLCKYAITSTAGQNGSISPSGSTDISYGSNVTFTATPSTGYEVDTWSVDGEVAQTGGTSYTLSNVQGPHTVEVDFKLCKYVITSTAGQNGSISPSGSTDISYGSNITFTASPTTGHEVDTWSVDGEVVQTGGTSYTLSNVQGPHTVEVDFKLCKYVITSTAGQNGSISPSGSTDISYGSNVTFTATPTTGHEVDTWSVDGEVVQTGGTSYTLSNVQGSHFVEVSFKICTYVITSTSGQNGSISPSGSTDINYGDDVTFTATPSTGYEVESWSVDGEVVQTGGTSYTLSNIQGPHAVEVSFKLCTYAITSMAGENGSISPSGSTDVTYNGNVSFTATPDSGYQVDTWSVDGEIVQTGGTGYTLSNIQGPHTVEVTFKKDECVITCSAGKNGSISPSGAVTVPLGGDLTLSASPGDGHQVDVWTVDGDVVQTGGTSYTLSNIQTDHSVNVSFRPLNHMLSATAGPNGSVSPTGVSVSSGGNCTFTAIPNHSFEVDTWFLDGSSAQQGGRTYYMGLIDDDHTVHVTFRKSLSYSLGEYNFEDEGSFEDGLITNNVDSDEPEESRIHVDRVVGIGYDPDNAAMNMTNLVDLDPTSPTYGQIINARVKGIFIKTGADEIMIRFKYLFASSASGTQLAVYLSDTPELLRRDDPSRSKHYLEVGRLAAPPYPRPGSAGSHRFGIFKKIVWTRHLSFDKGLYIELELVEPKATDDLLANTVKNKVANFGDTSVFVDSWGGTVQCYGICLDINWDNFVDEADFLMVVGGCGQSTVGETACMDGALSRDGYMDSYDVASWDWALNSEQRLLNYCGVPLTSTSTVSMKSGISDAKISDTVPALRSLTVELGDLLIAGKSGEADIRSKLKDSLYVFNSDGSCRGAYEPVSQRCNVRLVSGSDGAIYQLNSEAGLLRLDGANDVIVPPGQVTLSGMTEPRYNSPAAVYIGIQDKASNSFGRPLLDAAIDGDYVYVVPVVVDPEGGDPYTAAAKLRLLGNGNPPYEVVALYDEPPLPNDNQYRDYLREIEIDSAGNLYVLNVHSLNESDILWRFAPDGTVERVDLGFAGGDSYVPAPVGMVASKSDEMLYMTSSIADTVDSDSTVIYGFSTNGPLTLETIITVNGAQHITSITEDPKTGTLWAAGFNMYNIPMYPNPTRTAFYYPCLIKIPSDSDEVNVIGLYEPDAHDLALPMSVLWTK